MNKKGFVFDGLLALIIFIDFVFSYLLLGFVFSNINSNIISGLNDTDLMTNASLTDVEYIIDNVDKVSNIDYIIILVLLGIFMSLLVSYYYIRSNVILVIIGLFSLFVVIFVAIMFSDFFEEFLVGSDNEFSDYVDNNHDLITWIMDYLPIIFLVLLIIVIIVLYSWSQWSGGYIG
jgi:hypothetical protein